MFLYVNHFYNFCYREMKTILDRQVGQVPTGTIPVLLKVLGMVVPPSQVCKP